MARWTRSFGGAVPLMGAFVLLPMGEAHRSSGDAARLWLDPCAAESDGEPLSLAGFWDEALPREPLLRSAAQRAEGAEARYDAVRREWIPTLSMEALGNQGQRISPREERLLGVGPRGEGRLVGTWTLLSSDRSRRHATADEDLRATRIHTEATDAELRTLLAALFIEGVELETLLAARSSHLTELRSLAGTIRTRLDAGVDASWEGYLLEEAMARAERLEAEARRGMEAVHAELSARAGRCIRPRPLTPSPQGLPGGLGGSVDDHPLLRELRQRAGTQGVRAREVRDGGRFRLDLLGISGPTYSRAFDEGRVSHEYLVGLSLRWLPDLGGIRGRQADGEAAEARALHAEADAYREALQREWDRAEGDLAFHRQQGQALQREREQATRRRTEAEVRWLQGVDRWSEVIQARERLLQVDEAMARNGADLARSLLQGLAVAGRITDLPSFLGHQE